MVTMETILPEQLSPAIRKLVLPALKSLAKAQWQIYRINLSDGMASFNAVSKTGTHMFIKCAENDLPSRLESLITRPEWITD
jgi:hypothetical protein